MGKDIYEVLVSREEIENKVRELAKQISNDYDGKKAVLIGILKGGFVFLADLIRQLDISVEIDFMVVSSYGNSTESSGNVKIIKDIDIDVSDKNVIIVEDLVDTGITLRCLKDLFLTRSPASVKICTIFDKPSRRKVDIHIDYDGIIIPDEFVVGYGLDYAEKYRNLPELCIINLDKD